MLENVTLAPPGRPAAQTSGLGRRGGQFLDQASARSRRRCFVLLAAIGGHPPRCQTGRAATCGQPKRGPAHSSFSLVVLEELLQPLNIVS